MLLLRIIFFAAFFAIIHTKSKNACKNYFSYLKMDSADCYHTPDVFDALPNIIERHTGIVETYNVTTEDGYILTIFRIPQPPEKRKGVVILQPPVTSDSVIWASQGPNSTAFYFWRQGYDVWLPNQRGTYYSMLHVNLTHNQYAFWDFSYFEIGYYDMKSEIDLVKNVTNSSEIVVIGHSMGTSSALVYASMRAEEARKAVKMFVLISPIAYLNNVKSPLVLMTPIANYMKFGFDFVGIGGMGNVRSPIYTLFRHMDVINPIKVLVPIVLGFVFGWTPEEFDPEFANVILSQHPREYSFKILYHYSQQIVAGGRFQMFNYGPLQNRLLYGDYRPPEFPIENITVPIYLICSHNDWMAVMADCETLYKKLPGNTTKYGMLKIKGMNHADFHYGKHRIEKVYEPIIRLLHKIG